MPRAPAAHRSLLTSAAAALLLGSVGRVLVLRAPELASGTPLRFDEALSLFVAITFGPHWGAATSLVATVGTPEPALSAVWALEALLAGLAVRRGVTPVLAVGGYWLLVGAVFFSGVLAVPSLGVDPRLLLAKQFINGTLCAALAHVAASSGAVQRLLGLSPVAAARPLRAQFARALVPVSAIPVILLSLGLGRMYARYLVREGTADLETRASTVAGRLNDQVSATDRDVLTLAASLSGPSRPVDEVRRILRVHHAGTVLATMLVTDAEGAVVAVTSRAGGPVPDAVVPPVADRPYFIEPRRTGRSYRSNGFEGRGFSSPADPRIIAVSAPYTDEAGRFAGVVQGTVALTNLSAWLARVTGVPGESALVLDTAGQVVASTDPHLPLLLAGGRSLDWVRATNGGTTAVFLETAPTAVGPRPERWTTVRREVPDLGWQVHVRRSMASMEAPLVPFYQLSAAWLVLCLGVATLLAGRVSRSITHPLEVLALGAEIIGRGQDRTRITLPPTAPAEVQSLHGSLEAMLGRLDESMAQLDHKVRVRSAALAAAAAQHETIFRVASDGMAILGPDRCVIETNEALCRILGYDRGELASVSFRDLEPGVAPETRRVRLAAIARHGFVRFETELVSKRGDLVPVEIVATAIPTGEDRLYVSVRDISERRNAEAERAQLEARLRQSQKLEAIGTLAGGIAHDFNNILTLIAGNAELAATDLPAEHPARQNLDQIGLATRRAEALIRQILTFSRRRDEQQELVAVGPIIREAIGMLRSMLPAMIAIESTIDEPLPPVQGDAVQLQQVLLNLGVNAGHAMQAGGGVLTIAVQPATGAGPSHAPGIRLLVRDTGTGMDRKTIERAFEPFFTTKPAGEGTGLGLAVVHGIVTTHGGTIDVVSAPGKGTTFTICLPGAASAVESRVDTTAPAARTSTPARVLVVDDEPELVTLVCRQLDRLGFVATGCTGPQQALDTLAEAPAPFDLVLSDLAMPTMTGIELARRVRDAHPDTAVVLYSGRVTDDDSQQAKAAGIVEILGKPFTRDQLAGALGRALESRALTRGTTSVP